MTTWYNRLGENMDKTILIRYGDLVLKGKNRNIFSNQVNKLIREKLKQIEVIYEYDHNHVLITFNEKDYEKVIKRLKLVTGIHSFSVVYRCEPILDEIAKLAIKVINEEIKEKTTFKIETKRLDKNFPNNSIEISQIISKKILPYVNNVLVDVRKPKEILNIVIRHNEAMLFLHKEKALGGFPIGVGGKGLVMLSGGIDSPVSAYMMMKQGVITELFHFESTPLTPLESVQKVIDISSKLAKYMPRGNIKLHLVPFTKIHKEILNNVSESYSITIMRRMMYRLAEQYAINNNINSLINGESVNQVASQTLDSLLVVESVTSLPILRPVIAFDKDDIINISKEIDTYDISIRPFNDCCSIYVPKKPVIHPTTQKALYEENKFDYKPLIEETLLNIKTLIIREENDINILNYGFDLEDALNNIKDIKNVNWIQTKSPNKTFK